MLLFHATCLTPSRFTMTSDSKLQDARRREVKAVLESVRGAPAHQGPTRIELPRDLEAAIDRWLSIA